MPNNKNLYSLRHIRQFKTASSNIVYHGTENVSFSGSKIWETLPDDFKKIEIIEAFKRAIKTWKSENCPWIFFRLYTQNIGFP